MSGWRAYLADGSTTDSTDVDPHELPNGIVGIVEFQTPPYRRIVDGGDWYWFDDGWQASESYWGGWVEKPHPDAIRGVGLPDDEWERVRREMLNDREWPDGD